MMQKIKFLDYVSSPLILLLLLYILSGGEKMSKQPVLKTAHQ